MTIERRRSRAPFGRLGLRLSVALAILAVLPSASIAAITTPASPAEQGSHPAVAAPLAEPQFARRLSS
jgi:hypothetical protein